MRLPAPVNSDNSHDTFPFLSYDWPADGAKIYFARSFLGNAFDFDIYEATWRLVGARFRRGDCNDDGEVNSPTRPAFSIGSLREPLRRAALRRSTRTGMTT